MFLRKIKSTWWPEVLFLTAISALAYLPQAANLSFHSDDWYFIYNGLVSGPRAFIDLTLHTRPMRGPLYALLFSLYGLHPLPYNLTLYLWRWLGGLGALWLFKLLWPRQRQAGFFLTVLFVIFPGFLWWVAGFEEQPYVLSLTLQTFSVVFTLLAIGSNSRWKWVGLALAAILAGWVYLALVEFSIGAEAFRILAIFLLLGRKQSQTDFKYLAVRTIRASLPFLIIPAGFVFWYQFLFDNWRKAQQAGVQLGRIFSDPLTGVSWLVGLLQGFLNVTLLAWVVPFNAYFYSGGLREMLIRLALAVVVIALGIFAFFYFSKPHPAEVADDAALQGRWQSEMLWLGFSGTLAGILPVVLANRTVTFSFSPYLLPPSLAGILFLGGLVYSIFPGNLRIIVLSTLIGLAALTHQAIASRAMYEQKTIYDFWWQVTWRAPSIRSGTTLLATYPFGIGDGDSLVWGPANFIYYPEPQNQSPIVVPISALTWQGDTIRNIILGKKADTVNRVVTNASFHYDYNNILMMTQPGNEACVRVINPLWPEYSINDDTLMLASAPYSQVDNIVSSETSPVPPQPPFGTEPSHGWCYFYQKADLARQQGNWADAVRRGDEARKLGLSPNDPIEWMPFLQAYAYAGDIQSLDTLAKSFKGEPYYKRQACQNLRKMNDGGYPFPPPALDEITRLFCDD